MAEPARKFEPDVEPEIAPPFLKGLDGGGESNPSRGNLEAVKNQESNPAKLGAGSVAEREKKGSNVVKGPWKNNTNGASSMANAMKPGGLKNSLKKRSPLLAIILTVVGLVGGVGLFGGSSLLPMSILANVVQKFNTQETSMTLRTNKMFASKLANNYTTGSCTLMPIFCRFTRPSNRFLSQLEEQGIQLMNKKGEIIKASKWLPNERPAKYVYFDSEGKGITVPAKGLKKQLAKDLDFQSRFYNATKTRFMSLTDSIFQSIKAKFGFNLNDRLKTTTDEKGVTDEANTLSATEDNGIKAAASGGEAAAEAEGEQIAKDEGRKVTEDVENSGKGNAIGLIAAGICAGTDVPGLIIEASRAYQMAQLIKYSVVFLSAFGAIKAGDATPAEVGAIGAVLTKVVKGKSAMDSFGMRYVMNGDTNSKNNNYQKFSPGTSMLSKFSGLASIGRSPATKNACRVMTNPATGAGIDAAATGATLGAAAIAAAANVVGGYIAGYVIGLVLPPILNFAISHLPMESLLKYAFGDITQGISGEAVGDALTSGASHVMGQTANAGGNMPLTPSQAVAYDDATKQVQLAYAEEDRATKSPLDASSPNTFLGTLIQRLVPYYEDSSSTAGTISNTFGTMAKMVMGSFSLALQPLTVSAASSGQDQYTKLCNDPEITGNDIAAGPFCNIIYGIPTKYLDKDPADIVTSLVNSGDIDATSGDPTGDYAKWLTLCTDGTTTQADNCKITDKTADFALYTVDHRVQKAMDDDPTTTTTTPASTPSITPSTSDAKQLAQQILANSKIDLTTGRLVKTDIQDAADGKNGSAGVMTSTAILQLIATLGQTHTLSVSAIQSGGTGHTTGSEHYKGNAVDFNILDGSHVHGRDGGSFTIIRTAEGIWPSGSAFGQKQCGSAAPLPSGWSTFDDACTHIHLQVPQGTP